ncbi:MAG: diadenylate cyclase CdaA [Lachnospiraceae bacterium]|nr:diadenylate cyclase CdaA [Lachnospiraceae bacterium]
MGKLGLTFEKMDVMLTLPKMGFMDFIEIILIAVLVYYVIKWIKNTRAWVIVKGLIVLLAAWMLASVLNFDVILWIFSNTIGVGIIAIIILFQPELRKVLEQLGTKKIWALGVFNDTKEKEVFSETTVNELVRGTFELARAKTGALIVIEQEVVLSEYAQTGIAIDGIVTSQLLINIFEHNTPLHDGAVIVRGNRVVSATCYLPLSDNMRLSKELGTRHRAGVGISEATDSFTIIVSEETGRVSIARGGSLIYNVDGDFLRTKLMELRKEEEVEKKIPFAKGRRKK